MHANSLTIGKSVVNEAHLILRDLDDFLLTKWKLEPHGLLSGAGGASLYFKHRYLQTQRATFLDLAIEILEKEVEKTNQSNVDQYASLGSASVSSCWLIDQFVAMDILDSEEKVQSKQWINLAVGSTTNEELVTNRHDLFYGFIGKALVAMEHDSEMAFPFVSRIIDVLLDNIKQDADGAYWTTPKPPYVDTAHIINLGIPHGMLGIILFLIKCCRIYKLEPRLINPIDRVMDWVRNRLAKHDNALPYEYSDRVTGSGNLGWCYGDLAIAYTLMQHHHFSQNQNSLKKAIELIEQAMEKVKMKDVTYNEEFDIHDMCLCHGTASISYMYKKLSELLPNPLITQQSEIWIYKTMDSLRKYIQNSSEIESRQLEYFNTSCSFLNGLSGVGLVLMSFIDVKNTQWERILLLDHGRNN